MKRFNENHMTASHVDEALKMIDISMKNNNNTLDVMNELYVKMERSSRNSGEKNESMLETINSVHNLLEKLTESKDILKSLYKTYKETAITTL